MGRAAVFALRRAGSLIWRTFVLAFGIVLGANTLVLVNDLSSPVSDVFQPISIHIPNFCQGSDPKITYARVIRKPLVGTHVAHYDTPGHDGFPLLQSPPAGLIPYRPKSQLYAYPYLSEFMGRHPALEPGEYMAVVTWTFYRPWHSPQSVWKSSNVFTVQDCPPTAQR